MARFDEHADISDTSISSGSGSFPEDPIPSSPDAYELTKPFLIDVVENYQLNTETINSFTYRLLSDLVHKHNWSRDRIDRMKPCLVRFVRDVMAGRIGIAPGADESPEARDGGARRSSLRPLKKQALDTPTADDLVAFLDFAVRFRRLSIWNARMAQLQRPDARIIASEHGWTSVGRHVLPDAVPIILLWPSAPIKLVYELDDTGPPVDRSAYRDPFAVDGGPDPRAFDRLVAGLARQEHPRIEVKPGRTAFDGAASAAGRRRPPATDTQLADGASIGAFAEANATTRRARGRAEPPSYRIVLDKRLDERGRLVVLAHELGRIFCGHLGTGKSRPADHDARGWSDRRWLGAGEMAIEAEAVSYLVAARGGLVAASARSLHRHATAADMDGIDVDVIVRAAARIERLARIHRGTMKGSARRAA
jgi:hypothetical protein